MTNQYSPEDDRETLLMAYLSAYDIETRTYAHPPVFTVEEAKALRGHIEGVHTKNLFLEDREEGLWLCVVREELRVDLKALAKQLGCSRFSFGSPELLMDILGVPPGSVSPFALINDGGDVTCILDEGMLVRSPLNFHPLRNDRTTQISPEDLLRFLHETEHEPLIVKIPEK